MKDRDRIETLKEPIKIPPPDARRRATSTFDEIDIGEQRESSTEGSATPPADGGSGSG